MQPANRLAVYSAYLKKLLFTKNVSCCAARNWAFTRNYPRIKFTAMETDDKGKSEKAFANFGKKVDSFVEELGEAGERLQKEFQVKYEELKQSAEKMKSEENKERWKEVEDSLKKAGNEFSNAFKAAFKKRE